ncbi:hypothetical protein ACVMB3_001461 [Sinorhizobium meliloti]
MSAKGPSPTPRHNYGMHISLVVQPFADLLRSGGICISSSGEACGWVLGIKPVCANIGISGHPPLIRLPAPSPRRRGRRDKRRQLNPAFTARPRERAGAAYPFSPPAGRRWRQPVEGNRDRAGLRRLGSRGIPFMSSIRRTGAQEICACRSSPQGGGARRLRRPSVVPAILKLWRRSSGATRARRIKPLPLWGGVFSKHDHLAQSFLSATVCVRWLGPFCRMRSARGRVGRMF